MMRPDGDAELARRNNMASRVKPDIIYLAGLPDETAAAITSRFGPRNTRSRYRYVSYFKPVLAVVSADLPEMAPPLENLTARELQDSFYYRRPDGMIHYAIDIFRPIGEPLLAAVDGYVERIDPNPLGGNVVYLVDEIITLWSFGEILRFRPAYDPYFLVQIL